MENDAFLTVAEFARVLKVRPKQIYRLLRNGTLPAIRPSPRGTRIPRSALRALLERIDTEC